jgi:hypothetical protein
LSDALDFLKDKEIVKKNTFGNNSKGTGNYGSVAPYGRRCYRDWQLSPKTIVGIEEVDGKAVQVEKSILKLQTI